MKLTAAICTAGERETLEVALRTLISQDFASQIDFEVIVVDNSRRDGDFVRGIANRVVYDEKVPIRYVRERNVGLGYARNTATAAAKGEIVAFLDDDVIVTPNWASELIAAYQETDAAVVGGRIFAVWLAERPAWLGDELLGYLSILDYGPRRLFCSYPRYPFGANISFNRQILLDVGGFATNLGGGGTPTYLMDEIDVCRRIEAIGKAILYVPSAGVGHIIPASRLTKRFFFNRAVLLGRATAQMGWQRGYVGRYALAKGMLPAVLRILRHTSRAVRFTLGRQQQRLLSEGRHLAWNLGWMWEACLIAAKG